MLSQIVGIFLDNSIASSAELSELVSGKTITYSFDAKADSNIDLSYGKNGNTKSSSLTNEWQRFYITFNNAENCTIFFYNKSATVATFYIRNIKLIFGEGDTSYSLYGQGSAEIKEINSNILPILNLGSRWGYTENGLKNLLQNAGSKIFNIFLKKGQTIKLNFRRMSVISKTNSCSFTVYVDGVQNSNLNFANFQDYSTATPSPIYTRTYTAEKDCEIYAILWGNSENETLEFQLWANLDNATEFEKYQEQAYTLPIQQPMLKGDYFEKEADGWKEVHTWTKAVFDGSTNVFYLDTTKEKTQVFNRNNLSPRPLNDVVYCNYFKKDDSMDDTEKIKLTPKAQTPCLYIAINKDRLTEVTVEGFNQFLQEKAKTEALYAYYQIVTPTKLPCTSEQSKVLDQLSELDLFKGTNNIITVEDLALMQMTYTVDTKAYIDSKIANTNAQILNN